MITKHFSALLLCASLAVFQPVHTSSNTQNKLVAGLVGSTIAYCGIFTTAQWWSLGTRVDELKTTKNTGPLVERNRFVSPYDYKTGYALWSAFTDMSKREKNQLKNQLIEEICVAEGINRNNTNATKLILQSIERTLGELVAELENYKKLTPFMLRAARNAGLMRNPKELITSDYCIDYDIAREDLPVGRALNDLYQGYAFPLSFKYTWSNTFGMRVPYWFTWTYKKATECSFEVLQQYARIRAIQRILEQYYEPEKPTQNVNLNVKQQRLYPQLSGNLEDL